jgi:hypothetical protein
MRTRRAGGWRRLLCWCRRCPGEGDKDAFDAALLHSSGVTFVLVNARSLGVTSARLDELAANAPW